MITYHYWRNITLTAILNSNELPVNININGQSRHKIPRKRLGAFKTTNCLISLIRSIPFCNWMFWFSRSVQLSPALKRLDWTIQVDCPIPTNQFKNFSRTSPSIEQSYWPIRYYSQIFFDQVNNFYNFKRSDWPISSWFSNLLKLRWEIISTLSNIIGPIYWRICASLKRLHWLIVEEPSPIWAI